MEVPRSGSPTLFPETSDTSDSEVEAELQRDSEAEVLEEARPANPIPWNTPHAAEYGGIPITPPRMLPAVGGNPVFPGGVPVTPPPRLSQILGGNPVTPLGFPGSVPFTPPGFLRVVSGNPGFSVGTQPPRLAHLLGGNPVTTPLGFPGPYTPLFPRGAPVTPPGLARILGGPPHSPPVIVVEDDDPLPDLGDEIQEIPPVEPAASSSTSPPNKKRKRVLSPKAPPTPPPARDSDSSECPICFESWSNSDEHRLVSLKCGHLFGKSCIVQWISGRGQGHCPQCKTKATKRDLRHLYAKTIATVDTTERDRALEGLKEEKKARRQAEMEAATLRLQYQTAQEEVRRLQQSLHTYQQQRLRGGDQAMPGPSQVIDIDPSAPGPSQSASQTQNIIGGKFQRFLGIVINEGGGCRVMCYSPMLATLVVSQPSNSTLFPGYGIKKISALDFKSTAYVPLHQGMIRDLAFKKIGDDGLLLSCSMDKTIKITSLVSNTITQTYKCPQPVWSCAWNTDYNNYFYAGLQNGLVKVFDIRNTKEDVDTLNRNGPPVVALDYLERDVSSAFRPGGLFVGQLNGATFYEAKNEKEFVPHLLPKDGQLVWLDAYGPSRHVLASYRPGNLKVYEMSHRGGAGDVLEVQANPLSMFDSGRSQTVLTRCRLLEHPGDSNKILVCSSTQNPSMVKLWHMDTGVLYQKINVEQTVLDICDIDVNGRRYLATLNEKSLHLLKWG